MKFLKMQYSPTLHRSLFGPNILLSLISTILCLPAYQVSHPGKTAAKCTVLHISIFAFLGNRREDKRFCTDV
jgi:hypothetical protein